MKILNTKIIDKQNKSLTRTIAGFAAVLVICIAGYILSFLSNKLFVSVIAGILSVLICSAYYFLLCFKNIKQAKLFREIATGLKTEDKFVFIGFDGETEENGVELLRLNTSYRSDDGEEYTRTLYFIKSLPLPKLKPGDEYMFVTHRNIIVEIKD